MESATLDVASLDGSTIEAMFRLYADYYENVDRDRFEADLRAKQRVLLVRAEGALAGFTTIGLFDFLHSGERVRILFSGDTIMDRNSWGDQTLAFAWLREIGRISAEDGGRPLYWLLIAKGHRTFRYLPTFSLDFVPDWRRPQDSQLVSLRDAVAKELFGDCFDPLRALVHFPTPRGNLKPAWAKPTARELQRPDVAFFVTANPGFAAGDELVCLCSLSRETMQPFARRLCDQGYAGETERPIDQLGATQAIPSVQDADFMREIPTRRRGA